MLLVEFYRFSKEDFLFSMSIGSNYFNLGKGIQVGMEKEKLMDRFHLSPLGDILKAGDLE